MNGSALLRCCTANLFTTWRHSLPMGTARQWTALALALGLACSACALGADFTLTPAEMQRVTARQVVIRANLDSAQRRGSVRAAVRIEAPPDIVFRMMISCTDALAYVPHLQRCRI